MQVPGSEASGADTCRCPTCGAAYSVQVNDIGCPVCLFRRTLDTDSSSGDDATGELDIARPDGRFDHYEISLREDGSWDELGRGAMGVTYRAIDKVLGNSVALKVIAVNIATHREARQRFLREAQMAAQLRHPNVASVFYYGIRQSDGQCFYVMELVEGETVKARVARSGPLPIRLALEIVAQVSRAIGAAETLGLVHRDLKPANLMLTNAEEPAVKIIDFGMAKLASTETDITRGGIVGTLAYASPEQVSGEDVDSRSDLYSLGVTLWFMLTGQLPFRGTDAAIISQHRNAPLPLVQLAGFSPSVGALLERLLEKEPDRRFQRSADVLEAVASARDDLGGGQQPAGVDPARHQTQDGRLEPSAASGQRHWLGRIGISVVVAAVISGLIILGGHRGTGPVDNSLSQIPAKSIAVLPFENIGADKGANYFADGFQDEVLNHLAKVTQLKVISRTSVMQYQSGAQRNLREIAYTLGVANVLEGTVRLDGHRVRVTVELIDARNDNSIWADSYDRDLTDIFAIQSEVARTIATKLAAKLSSEEKRSLDSKPTEDLEAYDSYLRAKELIEAAILTYAQGPTADKPLKEAIELLEQAVRRDPKFTLAYCEATRAHDNLYWYYDQTPERRTLGDQTIKHALDLEPDLPEVHLAYAFHLYSCYRDYNRARVQLEMASRGSPNNPQISKLKASMDRRQGNWESAIREYQEAIARDPRNALIYEDLANALSFTRQFRAADQAFARLIEIEPDQPMLKVQRAILVSLFETGDSQALRSALDELPGSTSDDRGVLALRLYLALISRDWAQAREFIEKLGGGEDEGVFAYGAIPVPVGCYDILLAQLKQQPQNPALDFKEIRKQLEQKVKESTGSAQLLSQLAIVDSLLGTKEMALAEAKQSVEMLPITEDAVNGPALAVNLAVVQAWSGDLDAAFATLAASAKTANGIYYGQLMRDPYWEPLRQDPRYDKLLAELAPGH
jgi:TolB-like protein/Flp pilus assembly protein TadD